MEWIRVEDSFPPQDWENYYWVCDKEKRVFQALYTNECIEWGKRPLTKKWGFAVEILGSFDKAVEDITHWMPIIAPEPPNDPY